MGAVVSDTLETRLELAGLSTYLQGITQAAGAVGLLDGKLGAVASRRLGLGVGALAASAGIFTAVGRATVAAATEQETYNRAVRNFKGSLPLNDLQDFAGKLSALTGVDDGKIADLAGILGSFNVSGADTKALLEPILNAEVALRALGVSAETVSAQIGRALQKGDASGLSRAGIIIEDTGFKAAGSAQRVEMLKKALNQQGGATAAQEFRKELPGAVQAWETALGNLQEGVGATFVQPLTGAVNLATDLVNRINSLPQGVLQTVGRGAVLVAGALGLAGIAAAVSAVRLGRLATENVRLQNEQLKARRGTDEETAALEREARAHEHNERAIKGHAGAERTLHPGGVTVLPGGVVAGGAGATGATAVMGGATAGTTAAAVGSGLRGSGAFNPNARGRFNASKLQAAHAEMAAGNTAGAMAMEAEVVGSAAVKGGVLSRLGSKLKGGPTAIIAAIAADLALGALPEEGSVGVGKRIAQGAVSGAGWGAAVGSVVPGLGTGVGAALGGAGGAAWAGWQEWQRSQTAGATESQRTEELLAAILEEQQKQTELQRQGLREGVVDAKIVPAAWQYAAMRQSAHDLG